MSDKRYPALERAGVDEARALIGVHLRRRPRYTQVTTETLLRYAKALGSRNPLYADLAHGTLKTHWGAMLGHPSCVFAFDNAIVAPKLPGIHALLGGMRLEWFRQVRPGETISSRAFLTKVEEKEGRFCGPMVLQESQVDYIGGADEVVARATPRILRTPRDTAREMGKYDGIKRHNYSAPEFVSILNAYRDEKVRGTTPRYFEDTRPGEQLPKVVKGPLTTEDMNLFVGEVHQPHFFKDFVEHMRRHPADVYWHPDLLMPDTWDASLQQDAPAREFGFPAAHDSGLQRVAWLECLVTNWMSDLAMLRMLDVRLERPMLHADTAWLGGEVVATRIEDSRACAELALRCDNQRGERIASGTALVELPSRDFAVLQPGLQVPEWARGNAHQTNV